MYYEVRIKFWKSNSCIQIEFLDLLDLVIHVVLTEFPLKILRDRAEICRECFLFYYNFRIGQKIFIFAYIL